MTGQRADALVLNPELVVASRDTSRTVYWNPVSGRRLTLPSPVAGVLEQARTCAIAADEAVGDGAAARSIRLLREHGLLVPRSEAAVQVPPTAAGGQGLFGCRRLSLAAALQNPATDAVVIGMPYDVGVTAKPGARFGPGYLRSASRSIFSAAGPGETGMHDPVRGRRVLAGCGLADVGDISAPVHFRNGDTMDELAMVVSAVACAGKVPVVLGGDHSITLPSARAVLEAHGRLGILHFDAHHDYGRPRAGDWRMDCHHGNFMDWLVGDDKVACIAQFGVRQLKVEPPAPDPKMALWPGHSACRAGVPEILRTLPPDLPYYMTVDVDVLDPGVMPSTGAPLPGGMSTLELTELVEGLAGHLWIAGADIVELMPDGNASAPSVAAEVLLRLLDGALARRSGPGG
jgi:agmatinase